MFSYMWQCCMWVHAGTRVTWCTHLLTNMFRKIKTKCKSSKYLFYLRSKTTAPNHQKMYVVFSGVQAVMFFLKFAAARFIKLCYLHTIFFKKG